MQRWEYRLVALPAEGNGWSLAALDDAGRDGWQAVGIAPGAGPSLLVLVMRPCGDEGPVAAPIGRPIPPPPGPGPLVGRRHPPPPYRPADPPPPPRGRGR